MRKLSAAKHLWVHLTIFSVLLAYGTPIIGEEILICRIAQSLEEHDAREEAPLALLLEQTPAETNGSDAQPFPELVGWGELPDLPSDFKSGALVTVTGERLPLEGTPHQQFLVSDVEVLAPANLQRLVAGMVLKSAPSSSPSNLEDSLDPAPARGLKVLVMRPRLPKDCPVKFRTGKGSVNELISEVNLLQSTCTNGQMTYDKPVVTEYIDLPCMPPRQTGCDRYTQERWYAAAKKVVEEEFKLDTDDFDHVLCDFPMMADCYVGGWGLFRTNIIGYNGWPDAHILTGDFLDPSNVFSVAHEMGHNYGLTHANRLDLGEEGMPPDNWEDSYGTRDDSSLMGYNAALSCFSVPEYAMLGLASPARYTPADLPAGKNVAVPLRATWAPAPQGAEFTTGKPGQSSWRIWVNYQLAVGDELASKGRKHLMRDDVYNQAVILHLTSTKHPFNETETNSVSHVHRVRVMQSGDVYCWEVAGLVFKYDGVSNDSMAATLLVCRETSEQKCDLQTTPPPPASPERLLLPGSSNSSYCLQACNDMHCGLPSPPFDATLGNVFFTSDCPKDNSTAWSFHKHVSGAGRLQNLATGTCLSVQTGKEFLEKDAENPMARTYRLAMQPCNALAPPSLRSNRQLFLANVPGKDPSLVRFLPLLYIPDCPTCGVLSFQGLTAFQKPSQYLPTSRNGTTHKAAGVARVQLDNTPPQIFKRQPV